MDTYRILLLDDEDYILAALRRELLHTPFVGHQGLEIEAFSSPLAALARAREHDGYFDVVISDIYMPEMNGVDFLVALSDILPDAASIVLSGHADIQELARAINEAHIDSFLLKPWSDYSLKCALVEAIRRHDARFENRQLVSQCLERFGMHQQFKRKESYRLMVVDDDPCVLHALERELGGHYIAQGAFGLYRLEISAFEHADAALQTAMEQQFDVVVCDYAMPEMNGIEFLQRIRAIQPDAVRMLISGVADVEALVDAINTAEVNCFVSKPWGDYELRAAINRALTCRETRLESRFFAELLLLEEKR